MVIAFKQLQQQGSFQGFFGGFFEFGGRIGRSQEVRLDSGLNRYYSMRHLGLLL